MARRSACPIQLKLILESCDVSDGLFAGKVFAYVGGGLAVHHWAIAEQGDPTVGTCSHDSSRHVPGSQTRNEILRRSDQRNLLRWPDVEVHGPEHATEA